MKKVSKSTLYGIIAVLVFLLVVQGLVIHSKQKELKVAKTEYNTSKEMYADLESDYDTLNEDYSSLLKTCTDLTNQLNRKPNEADPKDDEQSTAELIVNEETGSDSLNKQEHERFDKFAFVNKVLEMYLNGEWDGYTTTIDLHRVSLDDEGSIKIDGEHYTPTDFDCTHSIDLPASMQPVQTNQFILGDGTYQLENNCITKYSKGKTVALSGGTLDWSGMDTENYRPFDTDFCYDQENDMLYLIATSVPYDLSSKELKDNVGVYLYSIPDRSKSEIKFIDQIKYTETNNDYIFDNSTNPVIKDFLYMERIMEFEFDWWCTFADGHINKRDAFPEGTFTHPVTTTPSVPLSQYNG